MDQQQVDTVYATLQNIQSDNTRTIMDSLTSLLEGVDTETVLAIVHRLADEKALPLLIAIVQMPGAAVVRCTAVRILGEIGGSGVVDILIKAADEVCLRAEALWALGHIGGDKTVQILIEALRATLDGDPDVLYAAQESLRYMGNAILKPLLAALSHENDSVRYNAADLIGDTNDKSAIPFLKNALRTERDKWVRLNLREAIEKLENSELSQPRS